MPGYNSTASWGAAQMRNYDWVLRHVHMNHLKELRPMMHRQIADRMFADELLEGHNMPVVAAGQIIIMKDAAVRPERPQGLEADHP